MDDQFIKSYPRASLALTGKTGRRPILRRRRHHTRFGSKSLTKALIARIKSAYFAPSGVLHVLGKKEGLRIYQSCSKSGLPGLPQKKKKVHRSVAGFEETE